MTKDTLFNKMNWMKEKILNKNILNWFFFFLFAFLTLFITCKHELWRDEAQNWLLGRDLSFFQLFRQLKIEGHPFVWLTFLKFFVMIGIPYQYSFFIPWSISLISIWIVLWKMPGSIILKVMVLLTSPFLYIAPAFVRSYCFVVLFSVFLASLFPNRMNHPYLYGIGILLLLNTHLITCGIPISLMIINFFDYLKKDNRKSSFIIMLLSIFGFLLLLLQLFGASSYKEDASLSFQTPYQILLTALSYITGNGNFNLFLLILLFLLFLYLLWKKEFYMAIVYFLSFSSVIAILAFTHISFYLCLMIIPGILFSYWNIKEKNKIFTILFSIILCLTIRGSYKLVKNDYLNQYSSCYDTALYIKKNIPKGSTISCNSTPACSSLIPYFGKDDYIFYDVVVKEKFTYVDWKKYYVDGRNLNHYQVDSEYVIIVQINDLINFDGYDIVYQSPSSLTDYFVILKKIQNYIPIVN